MASSSLAAAMGQRGAGTPRDTSPAPGGPPPREHRGATVPHAAPQNVNLSVVSLVGVPCPAGQMDVAGPHGPERLVQPPDQPGGDADVRHSQTSAAQSPLPQNMPRLRAGKSNGLIGFHGDPEDSPRVGLHPAGNVHRHHRHRAGVHHLHGGVGVPPERRIEPDTEQSVHHHVALQTPGGKGGVRRKVLQRAARLPETTLHLPAVRGHLLPLSHQKGPDLQPGLHQESGRGHAVPSIVSRPAKNSGPAPPPPIHQRDACLGHGLCGVLHQQCGTDPSVLNGRAVDLSHLRGGCDQHSHISSVSVLFLHRQRPPVGAAHSPLPDIVPLGRVFV